MLNAIVCTSILFSFLSSFNIITHLTSLNIEHQCHDKKCKFKITKSNMFFQPGIIIIIYIYFLQFFFFQVHLHPPLFCAFLFLRIVLDAFGKRGSEASVHRILSRNIFHIWNIILNKCKCADSTIFFILIIIFEVNLFHHCLFNMTFFFFPFCFQLQNFIKRRE